MPAVLLLLAFAGLASRAPLTGSLIPQSTHGFQTITGVLRHEGIRSTPAGRPATSQISVRPPAASSHASLPVWLEFVALAIVLAGGLALLVRRIPREGRLTARVAKPSPVAAVRDAVDASLEDVRSDPNARRAVIAAYRLMETTLASVDLPRASSEAPREYLTRALGSLEVGPDPPRRLTALFERAKFSVGRIDLALRDEAIEALLALREELQ